HSDFVTCLKFSPDGQSLASGGQDQTIRVWNLSTRMPRIILRNSAVVHGIAFSHDGKFLASCGSPYALLAVVGKTVRSGIGRSSVAVWDAENGKRLWERLSQGIGMGKVAVAFAAGGKQVVSADYPAGGGLLGNRLSQPLIVREAATGKELF